MKQHIIVCKEKGIYLGSCMGLGFWSKLDPAGQTSAPTFMAESQARDHVATWNAPHGNPEEYTYPEVEIEKDGYATMEECMDAYQEPWQRTLQEKCDCGKADGLKWRRLCTRYNKESENWMFSCEECYQDTDQYFQDLFHEMRI